jgi:hypothetical protein
MKCDKCGYSDNGSGDWAHACGPVAIQRAPVMNSRIQELALQAGWDYSKIERRNQTENFDEQKFAELIVRECMRQVEEQYNPVLEDEGMMKDTHWDGYVQCGVDSYVAIREHFGVEE